MTLYMLYIAFKCMYSLDNHVYIVLFCYVVLGCCASSLGTRGNAGDVLKSPCMPGLRHRGRVELQEAAFQGVGHKRVEA